MPNFLADVLGTYPYHDMSTKRMSSRSMMSLACPRDRRMFHIVPRQSSEERQGTSVNLECELEGVYDLAWRGPRKLSIIVQYAAGRVGGRVKR